MSLHRRRVLAGAAAGILASLGATTRRAGPEFGGVARARDGRVVSGAGGGLRAGRAGVRRP
ncbi:hypothetical protein, partial [Streptomyces sp. NPDC059411]|uniref:hypothetical protein n=1 Tax=Streptomyces sp. NPDC059411 TaxID=3346825 RepID=UPI003680C903